MQTRAARTWLKVSFGETGIVQRVSPGALLTPSELESAKQKMGVSVRQHCVPVVWSFASRLQNICLLSFYFNTFYIYLFIGDIWGMCVCVFPQSTCGGGSACVCTCRVQTTCWSSLLPPCGNWGLNSGCPAWQQSTFTWGAILLGKVLTFK